jgi:hypothetical protein
MNDWAAYEREIEDTRTAHEELVAYTDRLIDYLETESVTPWNDVETMRETVRHVVRIMLTEDVGRTCYLIGRLYG